MRASYKKYHWSVLQACKQETDIRNEKIADALVHGDSVNFWHEVNKACVSGFPLVVAQLVGLQHLLILLMISGACMRIFIVHTLLILMN